MQVKITKLLTMQGGIELPITDEEADLVNGTKESIVYLKRLDTTVNKRYLIAITKHWKASYNQN